MFIGHLYCFFDPSPSLLSPRDFCRMRLHHPNLCLGFHPFWLLPTCPASLYSVKPLSHFLSCFCDRPRWYLRVLSNTFKTATVFCSLVLALDPSWWGLWKPFTGQVWLLSIIAPLPDMFLFARGATHAPARIFSMHSVFKDWEDLLLVEDLIKNLTCHSRRTLVLTSPLTWPYLIPDPSHNFGTAHLCLHHCCVISAMSDSSVLLHFPQGS